MVHLVGYFGCAAISIVMMGVVFHALVWPTLKCRKKSVLGWVVSVVFGFGMLHSMAVKPDRGDALQGPRQSPIQQEAEPTDATENASPTNTPPWETTLAFSHIETTPSCVQLTVAWPMGFYSYDPLFDLFVAYPTLTNDWQWTSWQTAASTATNCTFTITPALLGLAELPPALFARVTERTEACETMDDPDGDGVPNPFEFFHGTNPYVPDANLIQTLDCADTDFSTLKSVLANSTEYSIINLPTGTIDATESVVMPPHPVLLSGPKNGYTVIKSTADLGAFMFKDGQDSHTLIRNVYLDLLKRGNFQVGFWSGGNLPWTGPGATPTFENIVVRTPRSETTSLPRKSMITYSGNVYGSPRNPCCWTYGIDVSSASPYNSTQWGNRAGALISKRHVIFARHYPISVGATIRFVGTDNINYDRTLIKSFNLLGTDIVIGSLSSDLPEAVTPAQILPPDFAAYINDAKRLPMLMYDASEHSIVTDSNSLEYNHTSSDGLLPADSTRLSYFEEVVSGDSGDPKYFISGTSSILTCTLLSYGTNASGTGPFVTYYKQRIQSIMNFLCPGYFLDEFDFSNFRRLGDEQ